MEIKSKFLCSKGVALAFAMLLGGSPGVLLYANDSVEESLMVVQTGRTIKGLVTDANGEPLIGCNVVVVGSNAGVITDIDGRFTLNVPADAKQIKVSYIGYVDQVINLHDRSDFKVVLKEDNNALDEVVVVGYGTQKKATLTGAVEQIGSQVLESRAITNVGAALQGATPGLVVTRSSSRPGNEGLNFQIRGLTSVNGGSPLIIVDGVPVLNSESFQNLNSDDIENISVLKDGSASIYGAKAANGVILVTTKKGKGKTKHLLDMANAAIKGASGTVVYLDKSAQHMYELNNRIRLINVNEFPITHSEGFLGFICGILSQDHDLETMYLDSFLKLACLEGADISETYETLKKLSDKYHVTFVLSISMDADELPENAKGDVIISL